MRMTITRCRRCQSIRPPNARFCPECGLAFDERSSSSSAAPPVTSIAARVDVTVWTGIKFGASFVVGSSLVGILIWVFLLLLISIGLALPSRP
jgi:hypothetical protein